MLKKIVIANTLKPVDDVRAFEKIAQSIAKTNKYELNIIGNRGKKESHHSNITFHPHEISSKDVWTRWLIRVKTLKKLYALKPDVLIVATHELLFVGILIKIVARSKLIYDVRENYKLNLLHLSRIPWLPKILLANSVRLKERISFFFYQGFWLAERCYKEEMSFLNPKAIIIENKAQLVPEKQQKSATISLLFSGTISRYSGILEAIHCAKKIAEINSKIEMNIVGQYHDASLKNELVKEATCNKFIKLNISPFSISHSEIEAAISRADIGIISYQENEVNKNKVPTKLYEYSRNRLPYLIQKGTNWESVSRNLGGQIPVDFNAIDGHFILQKLSKLEELFPKDYPHDQTWESQEVIISTYLESLLKKTQNLD